MVLTLLFLSQNSRTSLLSATLILLPTLALSQETTQVTALNFARAESDMYFSNIVKRNGGIDDFRHDRTATPGVLLTSQRDTFTFEDITSMAWTELDFAADIERANTKFCRASCRQLIVATKQ